MASRDVKVGVFVLVSLIVLAVVIFLIGDEARLFQTHTELRTSFKDVAGLSRGSPVRMGGVDIGRVVEVGYGPNAHDHTIYVLMSVVSDEARRVRRDSVASVEGKGLLGDKMVVITPGSMKIPPVVEGEIIQSKESKDFDTIISSLKETAADASKVMQNLERTTSALSEETFITDIKETVGHLSELVESINRGEGYIGRLIHSKAEADNISSTIASFRQAAQELDGVLASTRGVVDRVRTGPGLVHEVIYEESGSKAIAQVGGAAEELGLALRGIRQGDSLAHSLLYEAESARMVENMNRATADLAAITAELRQGKGTLGAFLTDPSVYDDIKVLLGNVGRNRSLRALVRYSVRQDEAAGRVVDPISPREAEGGPSRSGASPSPPPPGARRPEGGLGVGVSASGDGP